MMAGAAFAATGSGDAAAGHASGNASSQDCAAVLQQFGATRADAFAKSDAADVGATMLATARPGSPLKKL
ncbi:hypothetical protein GCM10023107_90880 [Actinoplanes octamycinicus]|nr:hypothetical protein Aoc01nite_38250 [Actinoplanes octamycinicus]